MHFKIKLILFFLTFTCSVHGAFIFVENASCRSDGYFLKRESTKDYYFQLNKNLPSETRLKITNAPNDIESILNTKVRLNFKVLKAKDFSGSIEVISYEKLEPYAEIKIYNKMNEICSP
jgi:hypothetical protein